MFCGPLRTCVHERANSRANPMAQGEGGGRPLIELSQEDRVQVEALAAYLNQEQIADYLGISQDTFQRIMKRDDEAGIRYRRGKAKAIGAIAQSLVSKARGGEARSQEFYLRTQAGWNETVQHTSPDGSMTPKGEGPVAIYALPDNGRDNPKPASTRKTPRKRKPQGPAKPKAKRIPRAASRRTTPSKPKAKTNRKPP